MKKEKINEEITRKDAIKKMGKYAAFTAIGTFAILNPLSAQNTSNPLDGGDTGIDQTGRASEEESIDTPIEGTMINSTSTNSNQVLPKG